MRPLTILAFCTALSALTLQPASAVGLGPLVKNGLIDGPRKAFYLTLLNPYDLPTEYEAYAIGYADETPQPRVAIYPAATTLGARSNRRLLVIASDIAPHETFSFRVCAERKRLPEGNQIHARVCSKLTVRRVA